MPETNAARAAEIAHKWYEKDCNHFLEGDEVNALAAAITAALDEARRTVLDDADLAIRQCASIDGNGYFCEKAKAIAAIRALLTPSPAAQPEGER